MMAATKKVNARCSPFLCIYEIRVWVSAMTSGKRFSRVKWLSRKPNKELFGIGFLSALPFVARMPKLDTLAPNSLISADSAKK